MASPAVTTAVRASPSWPAGKQRQSKPSSTRARRCRLQQSPTFCSMPAPTAFGSPRSCWRRACNYSSVHAALVGAAGGSLPPPSSVPVAQHLPLSHLGPGSRGSLLVIANVPAAVSHMPVANACGPLSMVLHPSASYGLVYDDDSVPPALSATRGPAGRELSPPCCTWPEHRVGKCFARS